MKNARHALEVRTRRSSSYPTCFVVDDHEDTREMMRETLEHSGIETRAFASAADALSAMGEEPARVLITDLKLPGGMSGDQLASEIRKAHGKKVSLVAVTGEIEPTPEIEHVFDAYLRKPIDLGSLPELVRTIDKATGWTHRARA